MGSVAPTKAATAVYSQVVKHAALTSAFNEFTSKLTEPLALSEGKIPIAIKDNIATTDLPTSCSSSILTDFVSPFPATVVQSVSSSYVPNSKTNMDEFGMGSHSTNSVFGHVFNPKSPSISAGGSSGGSAAAVASGEYIAALGTDTGGSVRLPAAYTGITGFKPSYGRISRWGVVAYANSLDTVGILAKSPQTAYEVFAKAISHDSQDPTRVTPPSQKRMQKLVGRLRFLENPFAAPARRKVKPLRIGVPMEYNIESLSPAVRREWTRVLEAMRKEGHTLVPISLPSTRHALSAYYIIAAAEASSNLAKYDLVRYGPSSARQFGSDNPNGVLYAEHRGTHFGEEVRRRILLGSFALSSEAMDNYFLQAQRVRALVQRDFDRVFSAPNPLHPDRQFDLSDMSEEEVAMLSKLGPAQVDVIVVPTAPSTPPSLEDVQTRGETEGWANDVFTVPASLAGLPACSVPISNLQGERSEGEEIGMQVIGQYFHDENILVVAEELMRCDKLDAEGPGKATDVAVKMDAPAKSKEAARIKPMARNAVQQSENPGAKKLKKEKKGTNTPKPNNPPYVKKPLVRYPYSQVPVTPGSGEPVTSGTRVISFAGDRGGEALAALREQLAGERELSASDELRQHLAQRPPSGELPGREEVGEGVKIGKVLGGPRGWWGPDETERERKTREFRERKSGMREAMETWKRKRVRLVVETQMENREGKREREEREREEGVAQSRPEQAGKRML